MARLPEVGSRGRLWTFWSLITTDEKQPQFKMRVLWNCVYWNDKFFQDNRTQEQFDRREKLSDNQFQYLNMIVILTYISSMMTTTKKPREFSDSQLLFLKITSVLWENVILLAPPKEKKYHWSWTQLSGNDSNIWSIIMHFLHTPPAQNDFFIILGNLGWCLSFIDFRVAYQIFCSENFHSEITFSLLSFRSI